jgi:hypothetical protein
MNTQVRPLTSAKTMSCGWFSPVMNSDAVPGAPAPPGRTSSTVPRPGCETRISPLGRRRMNRGLVDAGVHRRGPAGGQFELARPVERRRRRARPAR